MVTQSFKRSCYQFSIHGNDICEAKTKYWCELVKQGLLFITLIKRELIYIMHMDWWSMEYTKEKRQQSICLTISISVYFKTSVHIHIIFNAYSTHLLIILHEYINDVFTQVQFCPADIFIVCDCVAEFMSVWIASFSAWLVQTKITKFGPEVDNTLVDITVVLCANCPRSSRWHLT